MVYAPTNIPYKILIKNVGSKYAFLPIDFTKKTSCKINLTKKPTFSSNFPSSPISDQAMQRYADLTGDEDGIERVGDGKAGVSQVVTVLTLEVLVNRWNRHFLPSGVKAMIFCCCRRMFVLVVFLGWVGGRCFPKRILVISLFEGFSI